jgi:uncharacterized protein involved in exopolysaccharide biosynthesis/Mrp family chromosome partitioning ATPase
MLRSEHPFQQIANILRRRSRLIITMTVVGTALAGVGGLMIPPQYTAKAQIVFELQPNVLGGERATTSETDDQGAIQTQATALTSRAHLQRVIDSIAKDPDVFPAAPRAEGAARGLTDALWITLGSKLRGWAAQLISAEPHGSAASDAATLSIDRFERRLNVYQERGSHVIAIEYKSTSPEQAARVANRVAELHFSGQYQQKRETTARTLAWLDQRIAELRDDVEHSATAVQQYRTDHGLAGSNRTDPVDAKIADLNHQLTAAEADLAGQQARLQYIRKLQGRKTEAAYLAQMLDSQTIRELLLQEAPLQQSLAELAAVAGQQNSRTVRVAAQLQDVRRRLAVEVERAGDALEDDLKIAGVKVRYLRNQLGLAQDLGRQGQSAEVQLHELERQAAASRQLYENLLQRRERLREQQEMIAPDVRVLSRAAQPDRPDSPNPLLFIIPALIISSIGGGALAVVSERLDHGLRSARDVAELLGIPCLGLVPLVRRKSGTRPHEQLHGRPFAGYTEAIRSLAVPLCLTGDHPEPKVIVVSSSVPQEGKTTLAMSLAVYIALLGRRVLILDLDFRHPAVQREIGGNAEAGGLDLLGHDQDHDSHIAAAIQSIPGLGLDFLPVRSSPSDPVALFVGGQLPQLVNRLRASYDCIVIDGPPLLAVTEARLLAGMADKILFAVRWNSTRAEMAANALSLLHGVLALGHRATRDTIGAVITQVDLKRHARYRYGDIGETFVRYRRYYLEGTDGSLERDIPRLRSSADRQP